MNLRFDQAAAAIFVAAVLDGLDGRVARLTRTQSAFGAEYDSLADMVSFGAAPALIIYEWALKGMGRLGWIAAFVYVAGAALRLARFNTMLEVADKRWFTGMPSPAAAALVAGFVWIIDDYNIDPAGLRWWAWTITGFAGLTMVSNVKYYSFKTINLKERAFPRDLRCVGHALLSHQPASSLRRSALRCRSTSRRRGCGRSAAAPPPAPPNRDRPRFPGCAPPVAATKAWSVS
jgi:CDP-diacylglycerol--serine O-phosphatidyltransferase